jgi:hypothetical protein
MKLRMYGLVNYQLTGIQKGIQFLHAVVEYNNLFGETELYKKWATQDKTVVLLDGGTTNTRQDELGVPFGTLNQYKDYLDKIGVSNAAFYEEDLGDQLTSISFIVDERVFNKKDYPNLIDFIKYNYLSMLSNDYSLEEAVDQIKNSEFPEDKKIYNKWLNLIGGEKNAQLREFLKNFRLA